MRTFLDTAMLDEMAQGTFEPGCHVQASERLGGGSKKGAYRLSLENGQTAIAYVWTDAENFWAGTSREAEPEPFGDATGIDLFAASSHLFSRIGVRSPRIYRLDRTRQICSSDFAVVEDIGSVTLEQVMRENPVVAEPAVRKLSAMLDRMASCRGEAIGKVGLLGNAGNAATRSCEQSAFDRAVRHLALAASRDTRIREASSRLHDRLRRLLAAVAPRRRYGLVHGELGPDHVLVDSDGSPVIIDIEGAMFFDVEWEHVFLQRRYGAWYESLQADGLDEDRMLLYTLAMELSLVAGPLRLLDGDFPDREFMLAIVEHAISRVLTLTAEDH